MNLSTLIMAGGKGTRLDSEIEKPLLKLEGKPLIDYVLNAVKGCKYVDKFWAVTSPHTQKTQDYLKGKAIQTFKSPGDGYVEDLVFAITMLNLEKTLIISADLPLVTSKDLNLVIDEYQKQGHPALTLVMPQDTVEKSGVHADTVIDGYVPAGINIVDGKNLNGSEFKLITQDSRFAMNINQSSDIEVASRRIRNAD